MKKGILAICSVLLLLTASIAVLSTGCDGDGAGEGTIEVKATLCGEDWQGPVDYTLTPETGSPVSGTEVPASFNVSAGEWTCEYISGGDPDSFFDVVTTPTQTVSDGGKITFTLEFELNQDAWIDFLRWTVNGAPWEYPPPWEMWPCEILDVHFQQGVFGCPEYLAAVNETSRLWIHYLGYTDQYMGEPIPPMLGQNVSLYVVNDLYAVNKTVEELPDLSAEKVSQYTTWFGDYIDKGEYIDLPWCENTELDVETIWQLVKETEYIKSINWFGISVWPYFEPGDEHENVLFELLVPPIPGWYVFDVIAEAEVELMDDTDVNTTNDKATSTSLEIRVWVSP